jgi:ACS family hexuronate transporter-like MFS transporter
LFRRVFHLGPEQIAVPLASMYGCAIVGSLLGGILSRQMLAAGWNLNRTRKLSLLVCAVLALPLALVDHVGSLPIAVSLLGLTLFAHQGFSVNMFTLIADVVPKSRLATVTGIGVLAGNIGGMGILAVTGWILTARGDYGPVFAYAALTYFLALLWIHLLLPVIRVAGATE